MEGILTEMPKSGTGSWMRRKFQQVLVLLVFCAILAVAELLLIAFLVDKI